jgi:hypothetical protein
MAAFHLIIYGRFWVITEGPERLFEMSDQPAIECVLRKCSVID